MALYHRIITPFRGIASLHPFWKKSASLMIAPEEPRWGRVRLVKSLALIGRNCQGRRVESEATRCCHLKRTLAL